MRYVNPLKREPTIRSLRFPNKLLWEIHLVRSIDGKGCVQLGLTIAKPRERILLNFSPSSYVENRIRKTVEFLTHHLCEETPWYAQPEVIYVEEKSIYEEMVNIHAFNHIEFEHRLSFRRQDVSQKKYACHLKNKNVYNSA